MTFDHAFWQQHWASPTTAEVNPHLVHETAGLARGTALDAGCGAGAEAAWLSAQGWATTGVDIAGNALAAAADPGVEWIEADLTTWHPGRLFDLVTTHYAHASIPQLDLYARLGEWVAPGGTLLVVGHAGDPAAIVARFPGWQVVTAEVRERVLGGHPLRDVVVRLRRPALAS